MLHTHCSGERGICFDLDVVFGAGFSDGFLGVERVDFDLVNDRGDSWV